MSVQSQLDPLSRSLLMTIGRAILTLANGEIDMPAPTIDAARALLHEGDGVHTRNRRHQPSRRCYSVKEIPAKKLDAVTPAARRVVKSLQATPQQTAPELANATGLKRKTVENILSTLNAMKVLVREDVTGEGHD